MITKYDISNAPTKDELQRYVKGNYDLLTDFCGYIETKYQPKEQIDYSKCTAIPGWNLKYKKHGKALCTIYPYEEYFAVLVTLTFKDLDKFCIVKQEFEDQTQRIIDEAKPFSGTKWIILAITDNKTLADAKKLIALKYE
ncbi:MAG: DUF3788 domain-containing protein [Clostridia bacterium]|nr:DUF3788 domain-containing protein [Clostridia bacterium]